MKPFMLKALHLNSANNVEQHNDTIVMFCEYEMLPNNL